MSTYKGSAYEGIVHEDTVILYFPTIIDSLKYHIWDLLANSVLNLEKEMKEDKETGEIKWNGSYFYKRLYDHPWRFAHLTHPKSYSKITLTKKNGDELTFMGTFINIRDIRFAKRDKE